MPISSPISIRPINQEEFARIDYQVMRHAFDSQNELGRLCDEVIYQIRLTALPDGAESYEPHLRALLRHSRLRAVQWINMSRHRIEFVTLTK